MIYGECGTFGSEAIECRFFQEIFILSKYEVCIGHSVIH